MASICSGATLSPLPTTSTNSITGTWFPVINNTSTTTYTFTPATNQCATTATTTINVNPIITPSFNILNEICSGSPSFSLPNNSNNGVLGTWTPPFVLTNLEGNSTYTFTPNNQNCTLSAGVDIKVIYCGIQNGISPLNASTGDGLNDYFKISCKKFQIYNRHGMLVYSKDNYQNDWYGQTNNGKALPDATYYYVIETFSGEIKTGWVYINSEQ